MVVVSTNPPTDQVENWRFQQKICKPLPEKGLSGHDSGMEPPNQRFRALRDYLGLRQEDIAANAGRLRANTISEYERGETDRPRGATLDQFAKGLKMPVEILESCLRGEMSIEEASTHSAVRRQPAMTNNSSRAATVIAACELMLESLSPSDQDYARDTIGKRRSRDGPTEQSAGGLGK